jgi:branched-chain amino acid transport system ATP-binding protein
MLEIEGLTKRFGGFTAVNNVSFRVDEGEILGLIGPNGSGKSTIFNLISGAFPPTAGSIRFRGASIAGENPSAICHRGIARTFQIPRPFGRLSVLDNVMLSAYFGSDGSISRANALARAKDAVELTQLPDDADTRVQGLGAAGLKKLELARALATEPSLLLADESLGGLDEAEMERAADMLERVRSDRGITVVWVEHIMGVLMRVVDRCVVLDHGEIIADGLPASVAANERVIEVYLGTDAPAPAPPAAGDAGEDAKDGGEVALATC